jgi:hypothetical protein
MANSKPWKPTARARGALDEVNSCIQDESIDVGPVLSAVDAATAQYFNSAQAGNEMADPASIVRLYEEL